MNSHVVIDGQSPQLLTQSRYLIGRGDGCEILLPEGDDAISRRHALLERDPQGIWSIVDLGSRNGTFVNGELLTDRRSLGDGDRVGVGKSHITLALPRSQPTIAVEASMLPLSSRASPTVAVEATVVAPANFPAHGSVFVPPSTQLSFAPTVQASDVPKPAPATDFSSLVPAAYEPPPKSYEAPQHTYEPPRSVYVPPPLPESQYAPPSAHSYAQADARPIGTGSRGMGFVISGVVLIALCLVTYLAYIEPKMAEYQSLGGQLAGGLMSLLGNSSYYQQFQTLYYERTACIVGEFIGAGLVLVGVLKRR